MVLSTIGGLFPGIEPSHEEDLVAREIKGSDAMVEILSTAVKDYQLLPDAPRELAVDGLTLSVTPNMVKSARTRARRSRKPHNEARGAFIEHLVEDLAQQMADTVGADPLGGKNLLSRADIDQFHDDLAEDAAVTALIDEFWPELHPTDVLAALVSSRERIAYAAHGYDEETQEALYRAEGRAWTDSDAALLDELAVLIGLPNPEEKKAADDAAWREQVADAEDALDILSSSESTDNDDDMFEAEILSAHDVIDAETLAHRQEVRDKRTTAQRAREDHTWAYGHIIVDEAQELTPMEWRMLFRRCPSRWMTLVGDTSQTGSPAGVDDWGEALEPFVAQRFRHHFLTVNYRTPQPITDLANGLLEMINPDAIPATAIRDGVQVRRLEHGTCTPGVHSEEDGRLTAVIDAATAEHYKGLEFDHVVVLDPQRIVDASPQGLQNLYVCITRATQSLTLVGDCGEVL